MLGAAASHMTHRHLQRAATTATAACRVGAIIFHKCLPTHQPEGRVCRCKKGVRPRHAMFVEDACAASS
jgi:hypothetical protein